MRPYIFAFIFVMACALSGCATPVDQRHVERMNSFVGKTEREVIFTWGVPDKSYAYDAGNKVMTYSRGRQQIISTGMGFSTCAGGGGPAFGYTNCFDNMPAQAVTYYCDYSFNIVRGRVRDWFQNGNDCPRIR